LEYIVALATSDNITRVALDTIVAFVIPLVALLTSPLMWREEHLWNISVLQRARISSPVLWLGLGETLSLWNCDG
jgi:hypothetical protein